MSLAQGFPWSHGDWNFTGYSLAGITTSIFCKTASVCFDVGQGLPFQIPAKHVLITHAHLDHAAGVPYLIAQKNMNSQHDTTFYVPPSLLEPLQKIIDLWQGVDEHVYKYRLLAAEPGVTIELDRHYSMRPFATPHRVPSQGYLLYTRKKRLREKFREAGKDAILRAKAAGEDPDEVILEPSVAFTGDTKAGFLTDPDVAAAKILFMECTFYCREKTPEHARHWGHIHFDELEDLLPQLKNEKIVLIHASVRYTTKFLEEILAKRLSPELRERVVLFPRVL